MAGTDTKKRVLERAGARFLKQGVDGTSVQQIADDVGCTKAGLYYHFPGGKKEIFTSYAATQFPDVTSLVEACRGSTSLYHFLAKAAPLLAATAAENAAQSRWLAAEQSKLGDSQQADLRHAFLSCIEKLAHAIEPYVSAPGQAQRLAAVIFCAMYGYSQLFVGMGLDTMTGLDFEGFLTDLAGIVETH
jgi:AcrR family transcriptional regulator